MPPTSDKPPVRVATVRAQVFVRQRTRTEDGDVGGVRGGEIRKERDFETAEAVWTGRCYG